MNIIRSIITKPLFTLFCIIATLGLGLIAFIYEAFELGLLLFNVAIIIMISSLVYTSIKMNIIRSIITKPLLTLFCIIATLGLGLIAFYYEDFIGFFIGLGLVLVAIIIMIASVVYTIMLKKWDRLVVYLLIYVLTPAFCMMCFALIIAIAPAFGPEFRIVDKQFYNEHFESHSSLQNIKLNVYCKQDTIFGGIGAGGNDYSAVCIFRVNKNQVKKIENIFRNENNFVKLEISEFEDIIKESKDLNCSQKINYGKYGYKSIIHSDFGSKSSFVFSKDKNYLLFYIFRS